MNWPQIKQRELENTALHSLMCCESFPSAKIDIEDFEQGKGDTQLAMRPSSMCLAKLGSRISTSRYRG
jgi:hypothetical protein